MVDFKFVRITVQIEYFMKATNPLEDFWQIMILFALHVDKLAAKSSFIRMRINFIMVVDSSWVLLMGIVLNMTEVDFPPRYCARQAPGGRAVAARYAPPTGPGGCFQPTILPKFNRVFFHNFHCSNTLV